MVLMLAVDRFTMTSISLRIYSKRPIVMPLSLSSQSKYLEVPFLYARLSQMKLQLLASDICIHGLTGMTGRYTFAATIQSSLVARSARVDPSTGQVKVSHDADTDARVPDQDPLKSGLSDLLLRNSV